MLLSSGLLLLTILATASPIDIQKRDSPLKVVLATSQKLAGIDAEITNTRATDLALLSYRSILSDAPVEKVDIYLDDIKLQFGGILYKYDLDNVKPSDYVTIKAGEILKTTVELAGLHDFTSAGPYSVIVHGAFPYVEAGITPASVKELASIAFESNKIELTVDVESAAKIEPLAKSLEKRVVVTGCSGTRQTALLRALSNTITFANQAATAAASGSATKSPEYFRTTSSPARSTVAARFRAVASAAASTTSGSVRYYCIFIIAWTLPSSNIVANIWCDTFYNSLSAVTGTCYGQDQVTTALHELTHAPGAYSPGTDDNAYGYSASITLSSSAAILNADTYALCRSEAIMYYVVEPHKRMYQKRNTRSIGRDREWLSEYIVWERDYLMGI